MKDKQAEIARRVEQFAHYLRLMDGRTHDEADGSTFIIFDEEWPGDVEGNSSSLNGTSDKADWHQRFVQFGFEKTWFVMDLSKQTLRRSEAQELLRRRKGFAYARERQHVKLPRAEIEKYDPFRKVYIYGEEQSAAEDAAFIFFDLWKFPVDVRLYVTASAFGEGTPRWEQRLPIQ